MSEKIPCSVLVLTRNVEATLDRCLHNLAPFREILVHDANSEDRTVEIAKRYGAKILPQYNTTEKSVRVSNFTEIRLRERDDAAFDWVFYLDADEEISDEAIVQIGEILRTAHIKTIIKIPRLPEIDGRIRTHGALLPDIVPRIHHRKGGCTLRGGKDVHEKYVYDETFEEVVLTAPLYVPLPSVKELLSKDRRYILIEVERIQRLGYPWSHYLRWFVIREPLVMLSLLLKMLRHGLKYRDPKSVPFSHDWRYVSYHARLLRAYTGAMFTHPLTGGKIIGRSQR